MNNFNLISAYIATIIILVITIGIGVVLYLYFSGYISQLTSETEETAIKSIIECSQARIDGYAYRITLKDFNYRIPINITERSGNTLTDYQVLVVINTQELISQGKMKSDCGDIRFTDSDGSTLLNYWIESGCNTNNTRIWVKVPNIPARSNKTIYLYYGNPYATSMSNGDDTFIFFDDFRTATSINTNKWIVSRYSGDTNSECVISNNVLWLTTKSSFRGCNILARNLNIKYNSQYTIHVKFKIDYVCAASNDGDGLAIVIDGKDNSASYACNKGFSTTSQGIVIEIFNDRPNGDNSNGIGIDDETANCNLEGRVTSSIPQKSSDLNDGLFEIKLTGTQINVTYYDLNPANGYLIRSLITNTWNPNGNGYFMIGAGTGCSDCNGDGICNDPDSAQGIEYVFVRKYSSIEPTISLGSEETSPIIKLTMINLGIELGKRYLIKLIYEDGKIAVRNITLDKNLSSGESKEIYLTDLPKGIIRKIEIYSIDVCPNMLVGIRSVNIEV